MATPYPFLIMGGGLAAIAAAAYWARGHHFDKVGASDRALTPEEIRAERVFDPPPRGQRQYGATVLEPGLGAKAPPGVPQSLRAQEQAAQWEQQATSKQGGGGDDVGTSGLVGARRGGERESPYKLEDHDVLGMPVRGHPPPPAGAFRKH